MKTTIDNVKINSSVCDTTKYYLQKYVADICSPSLTFLLFFQYLFTYHVLYVYIIFIYFQLFYLI